MSVKEYYNMKICQPIMTDGRTYTKPKQVTATSISQEVFSIVTMINVYVYRSEHKFNIFAIKNLCCKVGVINT